MENLFDFFDAQLNWRSCPEFLISQVVADAPADSYEDDEEDWFFPQPSIDVPDPLPNRFMKPKPPVLKPVIYLSGMDLNCKTFERKEAFPTDFACYEDFCDSLGKYMYISVVDADNCDWELAQAVLDGDIQFDRFIESYESCL